MVDLAADSLIVEVTGTEAEIDALVALLRGFGIKELVRTGTVVMARGSGASRRPSSDDVGPEGPPDQSTGGGLRARKMYYDDDADRRRSPGQTVAVIGYGSQGHAHALNLHESGVDVVVGLAPASKSRALAEEAGLEVVDVAEAVAPGRRHHDRRPRHGPEGGLRRRDRAEPQAGRSC